MEKKVNYNNIVLSFEVQTSSEFIEFILVRYNVILPK